MLGDGINMVTPHLNNSPLPSVETYERNIQSAIGNEQSVTRRQAPDVFVAVLVEC